MHETFWFFFMYSGGDKPLPNALYDVIIPTLAWVITPNIGSDSLTSCCLCGQYTANQKALLAYRMAMETPTDAKRAYDFRQLLRLLCFECADKKHLWAHAHSENVDRSGMERILEGIQAARKHISKTSTFDSAEAYVDAIVARFLKTAHKTIDADEQMQCLRRCWCCQATDVKLYRCSICLSALYCSAACQHQDWARHKGEQCSVLAHIIFAPKSAWIVLKK